MQNYYNYINNMKFQSSKTVWLTMQCMKKLLWNVLKDVQIVTYILSGTYFCPNSFEIEN